MGIDPNPNPRHTPQKKRDDVESIGKYLPKRRTVYLPKFPGIAATPFIVPGDCAARTNFYVRLGEHSGFRPRKDSQDWKILFFTSLLMMFFSKTVISILKLIFSNIFRYEISSVEIGAGEGRKMSINKFYALIRREGRERRGGRGGER